jgi:copper(I)-binding protein
MKRTISLLVTATLLLHACAPKSGIEAGEAWMRPTAKGEHGAVYLTLRNYSATDDLLVGAATEAAESVELHESTMVNDVMEMNMLESVPLASGQIIEFTPGGLHIMLVNLKDDVVLGESLQITLQFETHADIILTVPVRQGSGQNEH